MRLRMRNEINNPIPSSTPDWSILSHVTDPVVAVDLSGRVLFWNHAAETLYGKSAAEMVGQPLATSHRHEWLNEETEEKILGIVRSAGRWSGTNHHVLRDGRRLLLDCDIYLLRDEGGRDVGVLTVKRNASETRRRQIDEQRTLTDAAREEKIREKAFASMNLFVNAVERAADAILITEAEPVDGPGPRILYVNQAFERMTGYAADEVLGRTPRLLQGPKSDRAALDRIRKALKSWQPVREDLLNYRKDGSEFFVELSIVPIADERGWFTHWVAIQRETTELHQIQQRLVDSEERWRTLMEKLPHLVWTADGNGSCEYISHSCSEFLGRSVEQCRGYGWADCIHPEDREITLEKWGKAGSERVPFLVDYRLRRHDGEYVWFRHQAIPQLNSEGRILQWIGTSTDISESRRAEDSLRERERRFHALAESLPQLVWESDAAGVKTYANQNYLKFVGAASVAHLDSMWDTCIHPEDRDRVVMTWKDSLATGEAYASEYRLRSSDGIYRHILARATATRDKQGKIDHWLGTCTDIHEQTIAQTAMRRSEKLATAGRLAASIAHEINNPLAAVSNILYLVAQDRSLSDATRKYLQLAEQELSRATHFTTQTLRFHKQSSAASSVDLGKVMDSIVSIFAPRFEALSVSVMREYRTNAKLFCYSDELRQVFASLLSNSLDAVSRTAKVRIRIHQSTAPDSMGGKGVRVVVADSGSGIPRDLRRRVFEAFTSTKESTGTGLGLWVTETIVRKHNGTIRLRSSTEPRNHGTVFSLFFPYSGTTS